LRLSSLEPGDLTPGLLGVLRSHASVVPHLHLPLQSGSDAILRRMNRQYRRDHYLRMADTVRAAFDRPAITTDIIVGFPGETDGDFEQTMEVVERVGFAGVHAFTYSPRAGTAAARWAGRAVPGTQAAARLDRLTGRASELGQAFRRQFVGESVEVLVERDGLDAGNERHGRCPRHVYVRFAAPDARPGDAVRVTIDAITPDGATGRVAG
jgi:MiaB/RimO family radical SAM methylthiotransferase